MLTVEDRPDANLSENSADRSAATAPIFGAKRAFWIVSTYLVGSPSIAFALVIAIHVVEYLCFRTVRRLSNATAVALGSFAGLIATAIAYRMARSSFSVEASATFKWTLGLRRAPWHHLVLALVTGITLCLLSAMPTAYFFPPPPARQLNALAVAAAEHGWSRHLWTLYVVCVAPATEEFMFRGVLFAGLLRSMSMVLAACTTTLAFVLIHVSGFTHYAPALLSVLLLGAATQTARIVSSSILPGIVVHVAYNLACAITVYANA